MYRRKRLTLGLLIYWGLLINLGPSLHTLDVFGLHHGSCQHTQHSHGVCCSPTSLQPANLNLGGDVACDCHGHSASGADFVVSQNDFAGSDSDHQCSFCEFFKYFQADTTQTATLDQFDSVEDFFARSEVAHSASDLTSRARGPPQV